MPRKKKVSVAIERASQPVVRVVKRARAKLSTGGAQLAGGEVAAALGGAVGGAFAAQGLKAVGVSPTISTLGLAGVGGVGAFLLDGKAQAAAVGAAASGLVLGVAHFMAWRNAQSASFLELQAALRRMNDRPRDLPRDSSGALDAARAQLGGQPANQNQNSGQWPRTFNRIG